MQWFAFAVFLLAYLVAFAGLVLPVLPGVPIAALGVLIAAWMLKFQVLTVTHVIIVALLAVLALVLDYLAGVIGAKGFGASSAGVWGSVIGSLIGIFFFPPWGFLLGAIAGAVLTELLTGRKFNEAMRAAWGVFLGTLGGIFVKILLLIAIGIVVFPRLL
ncbi:MAG: DUF456 domain-containing protein [Trueperaceae bacterium]|nr:DUF456 domain-containing protein [Trueperaceae bacterium]